MLKLRIKSLDDVDESLQSLYKADGDEFVLKVDGLPDVSKLKSAKDHEVDERKRIKKEYSELNAKYEALEAEVEANKDENSRGKGDTEALDKSWRAKVQKLEDTHAAKVKSLEGNLNSILVDNKALEIASEISVKGSESVLMPHIKSRLAVEEIDGKFVTVVKDAEGKPSALTLDELKAEINSNTGFAPILAGSQASGGSAVISHESGGGAPAQTLTEQHMQQAAAK